MNLNKLKRLFPHASPAFIKANSDSGLPQSADIEPIVSRDGEPWEDSEIAVLIQAYSDPKGVDLKTLSQSIGRTEFAVSLKASRIGITRGVGKHIRTAAHRINISAAQSVRANKPEDKILRSKIAKDWHSKNEHPRGFKGKHRTDADKKAISDGAKRMWSNPNHKVNSDEYRDELSKRLSIVASNRTATNSFSRTKKGLRQDLGIAFRSSWEANYARYLNFLMSTDGLIEKWLYEPETFWFEKIKRGCRSYKPDFKVMFKDGRIEYHEVKGWMYPRAKTALNRMRIYHPKVVMVLIDETRYKALRKQLHSIIPNWE